jgi:hypothetical protein
MKLPELSERHLAVIVAGATFIGGLTSALISTVWLDAGTERQTDVQLVQLAIGILSDPLVAPTGGAVGVALTSQTALRTWAVDIINQSAEVKFDEEAKHLLVNGDASFPEKQKHAFPASGLGLGPVEIEILKEILELSPNTTRPLNP